MIATVIICTHNPRAEYLQRCLDALRAQSLPKRLWELLIVDNCSDEPLAGRIDLSWHPNARILQEGTLGLTPARQRGIREAMGDPLVFVDDDNVLDGDFLENVLRIADEWPKLGAWGGQYRPGFEQSPPEWTRRYWGNLAIQEFQRDAWSNFPMATESMPLGPGLCVRRKVADFYIQLHAEGKRRIVLDRKGANLVSGGDVDLATCAIDLGYGMGRFVALKLTHLMPSSRLTEEYLLRLVEGISYSSVIMGLYRGTDALEKRMTWKRKFKDILSFCLMSSRDRRFFVASKRGAERGRRTLNEQGYSVRP